MTLSPKQITRALDRVLHKVEQPARYTGGELNAIVKEWTDPSIRTSVALGIPRHLRTGRQQPRPAILYDLVNRRADLLAERVYCPWPDFERPCAATVSRSTGWRPATPAEFDIVGFSLPYEQLYTNVLTMLDWRLSLPRRRRSAEHR